MELNVRVNQAESLFNARGKGTDSSQILRLLFFFSTKIFPFKSFFI